MRRLDAREARALPAFEIVRVEVRSRAVRLERPRERDAPGSRR